MFVVEATQPVVWHCSSPRKLRASPGLAEQEEGSGRAAPPRATITPAGALRLGPTPRMPSFYSLLQKPHLPAGQSVGHPRQDCVGIGEPTRVVGAMRCQGITEGTGG